MPRQTRKAVRTTVDQLDALRTALRAATALADEVAGDSLQRRLIEAFRAMPTGDRPTILGVVEREVRARLVSRATERVTGQSAHANPNARLYVRTHGPATRWRRQDADELMLAMLRMIRVASGLAVPASRSAWRAAMGEAI